MVDGRASLSCMMVNMCEWNIAFIAPVRIYLCNNSNITLNMIEIVIHIYSLGNYKYCCSVRKLYVKTMYSTLDQNASSVVSM